MRQLLIALVTTILASVLFTKACPAQQTAASSNADVAQYKYLLAEFEASRTRLVSGECEIEISNAKDATSASGAFPFKATIRMDFDAGRVRVHKLQPGWIADPEGAADSSDASLGLSGKMLQGEVEGYYFENRGRKGYWVKGSPIITVGNTSLREPNWLTPFDVRCFGLYSLVEFQQALRLGMLLDQYRLAKQVSIEKRGSDAKVWKVTLNHDSGPTLSRWHLWVDTAQGFTVTKAELEEGINPERDPNAKLVTVQQFLTRWTSHGDDVWVPERMVALVSNKDGKPGGVEATFDFTWLSVNGEVPDERFEHGSFNAPPSVAVVDTSLAEPVVLQQGEVIQLDQANSWNIRGLLVIANVALIVIILLFLVARRRSSRLI